MPSRKLVEHDANERFDDIAIDSLDYYLEDSEDEFSPALPPSKTTRKMTARRRAEEWWEVKRIEDDGWDMDYHFERKHRRGKSWRRYV